MEQIKFSPGLEAMTGEVRFKLTNNVTFLCTMQHSKTALKGLICALLGFKLSEVRDVILLNTIDYASVVNKEIILDTRVLLNDAQIINVELQTYPYKWWVERSLLYLCRSYDSLSSGEDYSLLKPTTHISIMTHTLFPECPEFYAKHLMMNVKNHHPYSLNFSLNVLDLNSIELATDEDKANKLDMWAKLFKAVTWDDLKALAAMSIEAKEAVESMYKANSDYMEKYLAEAHEKFVLDKLTLENALKKANTALAEKDKEIEELKRQLELKV